MAKLTIATTIYKTPEEYFLQIDLLIYVVDMQDTERYDESIRLL